MIENFVERCTYVYVVTDEVYQRVVAHTVRLYLNYLLGRPLRALMDLAMI